MASGELSRRVEKIVGYPPLCEMGEQQRRELHEALLEAGSFEDLPGKWQAAIVTAEQSQHSCGLSAATEPALQHLNLPPEAVGLAHRRERLDAGPCSRPRQSVQGRERQLRLPGREPLLAAKPGRA